MDVHDIVNMAISVNNRELKGVALERALAQKLRELLCRVAWLNGWKVEIDPAAYRTRLRHQSHAATAQRR